MKEDFDDILRKKWEEKQFPVDQAHRADMIRLLDQNNRRRTGILWWFFGAGIACTLTALIVILNDAERRDKVITPIENVTPAVVKPEVENKPMAESEADNKAMLRPALAQPSAVVRPALSTTSSDSSPTAAQQPAKDMITSKVEEEAAPEVSSKGKANEKAKPEASSKAMLRPALAQPLTTAQQPAEVNNSDSKLKSSDKKKDQTIATTTDLNNATISDKKESITTNTNPSDNLGNANPYDGKEMIAGEETRTEIRPINNVGPNEIENTHLVVRADFITDPIDALGFGNLYYTRNNAPGNIDPIMVKHHPVWLYAEAGLGFVTAPKATIKSGHTIQAGGGVGYALSVRQSLTLSGGYLMQKNGFDFQRSATVQLSSFGARSNFNTLTPDRLHFVYARLGIHHRMKRHIISFFGGAQYLYGAQGTVVVKSDDQLTGVSEDISSRNTWLKLDGMNQLWWNAELNYGYQLTPRFSIQAGVKYNFTSIVAVDQDLQDRGYYWKGDLSPLSPSITINYHLYGKR